MGHAISLTPSNRPARGRGEPIRVLIVDDSVVARTVLARMLTERPGFEIVAEASGGAVALNILGDTRVDVILLDLEMPGGGGLAVLPELIARGRGARVLIVSSAGARGGVSTMAALRLGAADTLFKPLAPFSGSFGDDLADCIRRLASPVSSEPADAAASIAGTSARHVACVGIGASTGGVHALSSFFSALPSDFSAPILITQHLPVPFMPYFAAQLRDMTGRPARIAGPGMEPAEGELLLAPGDAHLTVDRVGSLVHVRLQRRRAASGCLPSVDPMLESMARTYGLGAVGVVLSGMGRDGAAGAEAVIEAGGTMVVQDAASSVVWGMPGVIAGAGLAHAVLPPDAIARRLGEWSAGAARMWR